MSNIEKILVIIFLSCVNVPLFAQGELVEEPVILYRNEKSFGAFLTSNGMGADFRYGKRVNARNQILYQLDFMIVKHPKEIKVSNYAYNNQSYVFGKINSFFELKGFIGRQHELYRKNDKGGISIRYNYNIGPTLGILKPIYYELVDSIDLQNRILYTKIEKYTTTMHQQDIVGRASFFKGFNELSIVPGASIKAGISFEYSRQDIKISALEAGIGLDLFSKKIPILATNLNSNYFLNLTVGIRFGKVIDISEGARAQRNKDLRAERKLSRKIMREQKKNSQELENF